MHGDRDRLVELLAVPVHELREGHEIHPGNPEFRELVGFSHIDEAGTGFDPSLCFSDVDLGDIRVARHGTIIRAAVIA
jgi:hypothetical protein